MSTPRRMCGARPYIIAEIGVNHDGALDRALALVDMAADAGADAIKTQFFRADLLLGKSAALTDAQRAAGEQDAHSMLQRLEVSIDDLEVIAARASMRGLDPIVTVFSVELVAEAERVDWSAYKTASPDIVHFPLLQALAATGRPMIVSTGASTPSEIESARTTLDGARNRLAFLQCVSSYPAAAQDAALGGIGAISDLVGSGIEVGYSDHTAGVETGALAVHMGAQILEKHLTEDRDAQGPDHATSLDPGQFSEYVRLARRAAKQQNAGESGWVREKRVLDCEREVRDLCRQSIVAKRTIQAGETIVRDALTFRRPGTGLAPSRFGDVLGQVAQSQIDAGDAVYLMEAAAR